MTKNEADFCEYFYKNVVLESFFEIPSDVIKHCKSLLTGSSALCGGCYKSELIEMNNIFGSWQNAWNEYKLNNK